MGKKDYSEDLLIQAPAAEFLEKELGWQSVFVKEYNKDKDAAEITLKANLVFTHLYTSGIGGEARVYH